MNVDIFKSTQSHLVKFSLIITLLLPTLEYVHIFKHFSSLKNIPSLVFFVVQYLLSSYFPKPYIFSRQWQSRYKTKKHKNQNSLIYQKPMKYMNHIIWNNNIWRWLNQTWRAAILSSPLWEERYIVTGL